MVDPVLAHDVAGARVALEPLLQAGEVLGDAGGARSRRGDDDRDLTVGVDGDPGRLERGRLDRLRDRGRQQGQADVDLEVLAVVEQPLVDVRG